MTFQWITVLVFIKPIQKHLLSYLDVSVSVLLTLADVEVTFL